MDDPVRCFSSWTLSLPLCPPRIHLTSLMWWMLPGLPCFLLVFRSHVLLWNRSYLEAWQQGYVVRPVFASTLLANLVNPMRYFDVSVQVYEPEGELLSSKLKLGRTLMFLVWCDKTVAGVARWLLRINGQLVISKKTIFKTNHRARRKH